MSTPRPARLRVGVVGVGRVGSALGAALARAGHEVVAASGVSTESLRRAERMLPGVPIMAPDDTVAAADFVLLAVPDDVLRPLVSGLADTDTWRPGQLVAHTSGAQGIGVLDPAAARGVLALALHPVMTFTGRAEDLDRLEGAAFGVTALDELRPVAESLVVEMGGEPVWVPERARPLYHASLTIASNHLVTLVNDSLALLDGAGVAEPARLVAPLLSASLDNVLRLGDAALTGPVSRGDVATVSTHVRTLAHDAPDVLPSYLAMARRTAERAQAAGRLTAAQATAVLAVLDAP
ncbi:MAG: putative oxidoreductase, contains short-chain dehydrogenase and domain [Jatrophihabitans sp.]|nr:putative oxidoreductase, contains short-chain dehydrogenase and domain [Jatrophihabitans sp.]